MLAIIHRLAVPASSRTTCLGLLEIARSPLIAHQIRWLRAVGASPIVVELEESAELADSILDSDEEGLMMVPTRSPLGPRALAALAGSPTRAPVLAVPENVIGDGDLLDPFLKHSQSGAIVMHSAPRGINLPSGSARVLGEGQGPGSLVQGKGWAVRVASQAEAKRLGDAVELGVLPGRDREHFSPLEVGPVREESARGPSSGVHLIRPRVEDEGAIFRVGNGRGFGEE